MAAVEAAVGASPTLFTPVRGADAPPALGTPEEFALSWNLEDGRGGRRRRGRSLSPRALTHHGGSSGLRRAEAPLSAVPGAHAGLASPPAGGGGGLTDLPPSLWQRCCPRSVRLWTERAVSFASSFPYLGRGWQKERLRRWLVGVNAACIIVGLLLISFGAWVRANFPWKGKLVDWGLWVPLCIIFLGFLTLLLSLSGALAAYFYSRVFARFYIWSLRFVSLCTFALSILCFAARGSEALVRSTYVKLKDSLPSSWTEEGLVRDAVLCENLLGGITLFTALMMFFGPLTWAVRLRSLLSHRPGDNNAAELEKEAQRMRGLLHASNALSILFGLVGVGYILWSLFVNEVSAQGLYSPYMLLVFGGVLAVAGAAGIWAVLRQRPVPLFLLVVSHMLVSAFLLVFCGLSFVQVGRVEDYVSDTYVPKPGEPTVDDAVAASKAMLVVIGVLQAAVIANLTLCAVLTYSEYRALLVGRHHALTHYLREFIASPLFDVEREALLGPDDGLRRWVDLITGVARSVREGLDSARGRLPASRTARSTRAPYAQRSPLERCATPPAPAHLVGGGRRSLGLHTLALFEP